MFRRFQPAATVLAVAALLMLAGCAPLAMMPPITSDPTVKQQTGAAASLGVGLAALDADPETPLGPAGGSVQAWHLRRVDPGLSLGGNFGFSGFSMGVPLLSAGGLARLHTVDRDRFRLGVDFGLGWLYAMVGLPMAFRVGENVWIYSEPAFFLTSAQLARIPVGLEVTLPAKVTLLFEAQLGLSHQWIAEPDVGQLHGILSVGIGFRP